MVRAFTGADKGEPFLYLFGYVKEESVPIFLCHFDLAVDAKRKHVLCRFIFCRGLGPLHRLLPFRIDYIHLRRKRVSVDFLIFLIFLVDKNVPTLIDFLLDLLLKGDAFACSVAP